MKLLSEEVHETTEVKIVKARICKLFTADYTDAANPLK